MFQWKGGVPLTEWGLLTHWLVYLAGNQQCDKSPGPHKQN